MYGVHHSGPYNSTFFTNCCGVAINDNEGRCPKCREEIEPGEKASEHQRNRARWSMAYKPPLNPVRKDNYVG